MRFRVSFFCLALLLTASAVAGRLPSAEDIDGLAEAAKSAASDFKIKSRELRFHYEYSGRFLDPADKEKLNALAKQTSDELRRISESQQKIKSRIEAYEGEDWEDRYGETGLWRKLFAYIYVTEVRRLDIDLGIALYGDNALRKERAHNLLGRIEKLGEDYDTAWLQFLRARALGLIASKDSAYKWAARRQFDMLLERSDTKQATAFRIAIERIKLLGGDHNDVERLGEDIARTDAAQDPELVMSLACLQHRLKMTQAFEKTLSLTTGVEGFMGARILADFGYRLEHDELDVAKISLYEAELAAQAAWADAPQDWADLLLHLARSPGFQSPLILYVTASANAESRPGEAVEILIEAAEAQKNQKSEKLGLEAERIAEQAAQLACNAYAGGNIDEHAALEALESSRQIADGWMDEELEYCYASTLMATGQKEKGARLLDTIADTSNAKRRWRAMLDLITSRITREHYTDAAKRAEVSRDLLDFLHTCSEPNDPEKVRPEAIRIYCRLMLETPESDDAQKVVDILTDAELRSDPELRAFKSKALRCLGRPHEAAECLVEICRTGEKDHVLEAGQLLGSIIERFEQFERSSADAARLRKNVLALARYCEGITLAGDGPVPADMARLYVAEILLFAPVKEPEDLGRVEKLLDGLSDDFKEVSVDYLRCRARLLEKQGKFAEAGELWAEIAAVEKIRPVQTGKRSWQWWRAKYYELLCFSKMPETGAEDVVHSIEILENGFGEIPPLWAEKLKLLKEECDKGDDNARGL